MSCSAAWNIARPLTEHRRTRVVTTSELGSSEQSTEVITIGSDPSWVPSCLAKLAEFERLPKNWDGYRSSPIGQSALSNARRFLTTIKIQGLPTPTVLPVSGGGIGLNWVSGPKEVELTLLPDGRVEFLKVLHADLTREDATQEGVWQQESFSVEAKEMLEWLVHG